MSWVLSAAKVEIDQEHATSEARDIARETQGERCFSFPRDARSDQNDFAHGAWIDQLQGCDGRPQCLGILGKRLPADVLVRLKGRFERIRGTKPIQGMPSASAVAFSLCSPRSSLSNMTAIQPPHIANMKNAGTINKIGL